MKCSSLSLLDDQYLSLTLLAYYAEGVYETVGLPSVSPSVPSFGGFAAVGPAARRYRSIAARPALSSKCEQCHVVS